MWFFSIYNKLKLKNWFRLSPGKRQRVFEKIEQKQARSQNRKPLSVVIKSDDNWPYLGMFEVVGNKKLLYLNKQLVTESKKRFEGLETIFHEGRHAYQNELVTTNKRLGLRAKRWKQNFEGYFSSKEDVTLYSYQPIERDAQKYAIKKMKRQWLRFRKEEDYTITLQRMVARYEQAEKQARQEHGFFYKFKINRRIRKKSRRR